MGAVAPIPQSTGLATLGEVIIEVRRQLEQAGIESAEQEALWIMEHVLRLPAHHVVTDRDRLLSPAELVGRERVGRAAGRSRALTIYFGDSGILRAGISREPGGTHPEAGD